MLESNIYINICINLAINQNELQSPSHEKHHQNITPLSHVTVKSHKSHLMVCVEIWKLTNNLQVYYTCKIHRPLYHISMWKVCYENNLTKTCTQQFYSLEYIMDNAIIIYINSIENISTSKSVASSKMIISPVKHKNFSNHKIL